MVVKDLKISPRRMRLERWCSYAVAIAFVAFCVVMMPMAAAIPLSVLAFGILLFWTWPVDLLYRAVPDKSADQVTVHVSSGNASDKLSEGVNGRFAFRREMLRVCHVSCLLAPPAIIALFWLVDGGLVSTVIAAVGAIALLFAQTTFRQFYARTAVIDGDVFTFEVQAKNGKQ